MSQLASEFLSNPEAIMTGPMIVGDDAEASAIFACPQASARFIDHSVGDGKSSLNKGSQSVSQP
jgi:hypothetical protein